MSKAATNKNRNNIPCKHSLTRRDSLRLSQTSCTLSHYTAGMRINRQHYYNGLLSGVEANKFLYNGKELQDQTGYYDYGFRQYDPQLGRWHVIDAMAEKYTGTSPYAYVMNNPISNVDVMGLWSFPVYVNGVLHHYVYGDGGWDTAHSTSGTNDLPGEYAYGSGGGGGHFESYSAISISHGGWGPKSAGRLGIRGFFHWAFHHWKIETHLFSRWVWDDASYQQGTANIYIDNSDGRWDNNGLTDLHERIEYAFREAYGDNFKINYKNSPFSSVNRNRPTNDIYINITTASRHTNVTGHNIMWPSNDGETSLYYPIWVNSNAGADRIAYASAHETGHQISDIALMRYNNFWRSKRFGWADRRLPKHDGIGLMSAGDSYWHIMTRGSAKSIYDYDKRLFIFQDASLNSIYEINRVSLIVRWFFYGIP